MCDAYTPGGEPIPTNKRFNAAKIFSQPNIVAEELSYGIEQEYTLLQRILSGLLDGQLEGFQDHKDPTTVE